MATYHGNNDPSTLTAVIELLATSARAEQAQVRDPRTSVQDRLIHRYTAAFLKALARGLKESRALGPRSAGDDR